MEHLRDLEIKTGLSIHKTTDSLIITPRFLLNRFNIGGLLLFALGAFFTIVAIWRTYTGFDFYLMLAIGIILAISSALVTIKTLTDFLQVTNSEIVFRNSLKTGRFTIERALKVKVKTKKIRGLRKYPHSTISVDIYIKRKGDKYRVIDFLAEVKNREAAADAGKAIADYITKKIDAVP